MTEDYAVRDEAEAYNKNHVYSAPIITKRETAESSPSFADTLNRINALDTQLRQDREKLITMLDEQIAATGRLYENVDRLRESKSQ